MKPRFIAAFLLVVFISAFALALVRATPIEKKSMSTFNYPDALLPPDLPLRNSKTSSALALSSGSSPGYYETSEYMIGSVAVGVIFLESNGIIDNSTEDWTPLEESQVTSKIQNALNWWQNQNPSAHVVFTSPSVNYRVPTSYEPISGPQTDEGLWISEAMTYLGYAGTDYFTQVRDYVNDLRNNANTDWAFAIFVVDSSNDADGSFADKTPGGWYYFAYAYLGGPFLVETYDNDGWGIGNMDRVTAHEMGHIFYATDEYDGVTESSGYLNVDDVEGSNALMDGNNWFLSSGTKGQIGWRDTDGDGIQDIVDTFPDTTLIPYSPDPTGDTTPTYSGTVREVPYPNNNPNGPGTDITINTITKVEYRADTGAWFLASASDGVFDETQESFTFTTSAQSSGAHTIQARGINSVGNIETSFATDSITVLADITAPITSISYSSPFYVSGTTTYISRKTSFTLTASDTGSGVANTYYRIDSASWRLYSEPFNLSAVSDGAHTIDYYSIDNVGNTETAKSFKLTMDNTVPTLSLVAPDNESAVALSNVSVSWNGSDSGSGIDHYETKIDSEEYLNRGAATSQSYSSLSEGSHRVYIKAFDRLGNTAGASVTFVVDITSPSITMANPLEGNQTRSSTILVSWSGLDSVSGVNHYEIKIDGKAWVNVGTNTTYTIKQLGDGDHTLHVKAVDNAGNVRETQTDLSVNTSLIGGPGWVDDALFFGAISAAVALIAVMLLLQKRRNRATLQERDTSLLQE